VYGNFERIADSTGTLLVQGKTLDITSRRRQPVPDPIVLYSTVTKLAFNIARRYYNDVHYVWCSPVFDGSQVSDLELTVPPTSSPYEIYAALKQEVARGERHSQKIQENRAGILRGATAKRQKGIISEEQEQEIVAIVEEAEGIHYQPLILVIPFAGVKSLMTPVPIRQRASVLSMESTILELPRSQFDVIRP
jgi:hypothetical protein